MKIAWFSPFSRKSAIGAFSASIVKELSTLADVDVYASDLEDGTEPWITYQPTYSLASFNMDTLAGNLGKYDICAYNLGDNINFHRDIYILSTLVPGIVILHDLVMHHFFSGYYFTFKKDNQGYARELEYAHGVDGRVFAEHVLSGLAGEVWLTSDMLRFHMAKSAVRNANGVIVHSEYARRNLEPLIGSPVIKNHFPVFGVSERANRFPVNVQGDSSSIKEDINILTYGHINRNKMACDVIEAIGKSDILRNSVIYTILGNPAPGEGERLKEFIHKYHLQQKVRLLTGWRSDEELYNNIQQADIISALRNPHFGETSGVLHESMLMGKATIVWQHGYYDEVPDDTVIKINSLPDLQTSLEKLVLDSDMRAKLGVRARAYALKTFDTMQYCKDFLAFAEQTMFNRPVFELVDHAASLLIELGEGSDTPTAQKIIREIQGFALGRS